MHRRFLFGAQNSSSNPVTPVPVPPVPTPPPYPYTEDPQSFRSTQSTIFDYYGRCVALSSDGTIFVVGSDETSLNSTVNGTAGPGRVYVYVKTAGIWLPPQILTAADGVNNDSFGESVAISADGNTILVGAPGAKIGSNARQGAAYIFSRQSSGTGVWYQYKKLTAVDGTQEDQFGHSVAISADGSTVAVGAIRDDALEGYNVGSVYTFNVVPTVVVVGSITGSVLTVSSITAGTGKLTVGTLITGPGIPSGVHITQLYSGTIGGIGTYNISVSLTLPITGASITGSIDWTQTAKIVASDCRPDDNFGCSISMTTTGNYIAIGSYNSDVGIYQNSGAVYYYGRSLSGTVATYTQSAKLNANDITTGQGFGYSIDMNDAGTAMIIGAPFGSPTGSLAEIGSAYVFTKNVNGWTQRSKIYASDYAAGDKFGYSVAISSSERFFAVGSPDDDYTTPTATNEQGSVYVYNNDGTGWVQTAKLIPGDAASGDQFGYSVAMTPDAATVAAGAPTKSEPVLSPTVTNTTRIHGAAYIFTQ